jgi:hypothetical protein
MERGFSAVLEPKFISDDDKRVYEQLTELRETLQLPTEIWFGRRPSKTSKHITKAITQIDKERMYLSNGRYSFIDFDLELDELKKCFKCPRNFSKPLELQELKEKAIKLYSAVF